MTRQDRGDPARRVGDIAVATYEAWRDDRCARLGAGLAYYGLFAVVPVLTLAIALAALVFSNNEVQAFVAEPLARLLGRDAQDVAAVIADRIATSNLAATLGPFGIASTVLAATLVFVALQDALQVVWGVPYRAGLRQSLRRRLLAFAVVLGTGGVVLSSLAIQTIVALVGNLLPIDHPLVTDVTAAASRLVPVAVVGVSLALLFALLPGVAVNRRAAALAGGCTAVAMAVGVVGVGVYLSRFGGGSASQAAGAVLVLLTALYVECQILLAGAELSKVLTRRWGEGHRQPGAPAAATGPPDPGV